MLLEIAKKSLILRYLKALSFRYMEKYEILRKYTKCEMFRCAAINIEIVKKNKKQFQCSSY